MIKQFFSQYNWIEGSALEQLDQLAAMPDAISVAAMPDLHPGKYGPVGTGTLSHNLHPHLIGSDIGCGMGLFQFDIKARKLKTEKVAERLKTLDEPWEGGEPHELPPTPYDDALGTIGSGNHFCELQVIHHVDDAEAASLAGLDKDLVYGLIHTGSRGYGYSILQNVIERGQTVLEEGSEDAARYMEEHDAALAWAKLNRRIVAARAGEAARADVSLIADLSHNFVQRRPDGFLHRKGAAPSDCGLVPIPGSRETLSYLVKPNPNASINALACLAHGAGRKYDRGSMHGRIQNVKSVRDQMTRNPYGGTIVCEDRDLLIEEAGAAYKNIDTVIDDLVRFDLATVVATFEPLITFKTGKANIGRDRHNTERGK